MADSLRLPGVRSDSLLGYLKGLGLLRIMGGQHDPATCVCWQDARLAISSTLDFDGLVMFLRERWVPAPVVSPWNGGSGFFPKDNVEAFNRIGVATDQRLVPFQRAIATARATLREMGLGAKPDPKSEKPRLLRMLRMVLPDDALEWLDAAVVLNESGVDYPPALGSGGNDGRYDMANNYAQAVCLALGLAGAGSEASLRAALDGSSAALHPMSLAHLFRDASPVNAPAGDADALGNPWDLVLAVHGLLLFTAGATRRLGGASGFSAPFTLRATGAGYGSAVAGEKGRAELWLPVWDRPATLDEIRSFLREGRMQVGRRGARTGLDAARASGAFGVARGVVGFERFAVLERAGQSNLSIPAGRISVRPSAAAAALATLDPWLARVIRHGATDTTPTSQRHAISVLERAVFALACDGTTVAAVNVLRAFGVVERLLHRSTDGARPPGLRPPFPHAAPWAALLDPDRVEHRLAVGWASIGDAPGSGIVAVADALLGTASRRRYESHAVWSAKVAAPIAQQLAAIHERRWLTAENGDGRARYGQPARLADLGRFVDDAVDDRLLGDLVVGLAALSWSGITPRLAPTLTAPRLPAPLLQFLALAFWDPRPSALATIPRRDWITQLVAGRIRGVVNAAHLRLTIGEAPPLVKPADLQTATADGTRLAAALLARPADVGSILAFTTTTQENRDS